MNIFELVGSFKLTGLSTAGSQLSAMGAKMTKVGQSMTAFGSKMTLAVSLPIAAIAAKSVMLASDVTESMNVVNVTFGKSADRVKKWAKSLNEQFGMVELESLQYVGSMGAMLKSSGMSAKASETMSKKLVELTGDMSSFYNLGHEEMWEKIRSGMSGQVMPLKSLGINMNVANLEAYALSQGIKKTWKEMDQGEKTTLRYNYLLKVSKDSQGDFARTSNTFANQLRILQGNLTTLGTEIGKKLLPTITKVASFFVKLTKSATNVSPEFLNIAMAIAGILAVIGPVIVIFGSLITALGTIATFVGGVVTAISSIPLIIPVIVGLGVALLGLVMTSGKVRTALGNVFANIGNTIKTIVGFIKTHINDIKNTFAGLFTGLSTGNFDSFKNALSTMIPPSAMNAVNTIISAFKSFRNVIIVIRDAIINFAGQAWSILGPMFSQIGTSIMKIDWKPAINGIKNLWTSMQSLLAFLMPALSVIGMVFVSVFGVILSVFNTVIGAISSFIGFIASLLTIVTSVLGLIAGIFTMNKTLIISSVAGLWAGIVGFFKNGLSTVWSLVSGLVKGIIKFFQNLYHVIVGGSIVPDMIRGIIKWFTSLPGKIFSVISNFVSGVISKFNALKSRVIALISHLVSSAISTFRRIISGIVGIAQSLIGMVVSKFNSIKSRVISIIGNLVSGIKSKFNAIKNAVQPAINAFNSIKDAVSGVIKKISQIKMPSIKIPKLPKFADGVRNFAGGLAIVGEKGPELMHVPAGSNIYSNNDSKKMLGSPSFVSGIGSNGNTYLTLNATFDSKNIKELNDIINLFSSIKSEKRSRR